MSYHVVKKVNGETGKVVKTFKHRWQATRFVKNKGNIFNWGLEFYHKELDMLEIVIRTVIKEETVLIYD